MTGSKNPDKRNMMVYGGDTGLARFQNIMSPEIGFDKILASIDLFKKADLSLVNLESVVATTGYVGLEKRESAPFYFRGRPEMINILSEAGVDVVSLANNHSGDYGKQAFVEMLSLLDKANISFIGAGMNDYQAQHPKYFPVGDVTVALIGLDMTQPLFAASDESPGNYYLDIVESDQWLDHFQKQVSFAKEKSDLVFLVVHWGYNFETEPSTDIRKMASDFIASGIDCILGTSAHILHGVEIIDNKPVIYDAGNLLFDFRTEKNISGIFQLFLNQNGVEEVRLVPVEKGYCFARYFKDKKRQQETLETFMRRSLRLGSHFIESDGLAVLSLSPTEQKGPKEKVNLVSAPRPYFPIKPLKQAKPEWVVKEIPAHMTIDKHILGPVIMHGAYFHAEQIERYRPVYIDSYWSLNGDPIDENYLLIQRFVPQDETLKLSVWEGDHEPCDWQWPTSRWKPGEIYLDRYYVRPPEKQYIISGYHDFFFGIATVKGGHKNLETIKNVLNVAI